MDRERGGGYPDGLLLATPPYGSLNEREIGTTYGMRAQDAIAWGPRRFHFLTSVDRWKRARELYATVMAGRGGVSGEAATRELLAMVSGDVGSGEFEVMDARLRAGLGDPPVFARQWAANLGRVPHELEQKDGRMGGVSGPLGELKWVHFRVTLMVPGSWELPAGLGAKAAKCAE
jgi:hypothetical protein